MTNLMMFNWQIVDCSNHKNLNIDTEFHISHTLYLLAAPKVDFLPLFHVQAWLSDKAKPNRNFHWKLYLFRYIPAIELHLFVTSVLKVCKQVNSLKWCTDLKKKTDSLKLKIISKFYINTKVAVSVKKNHTCLAVIMLTSLFCLTRPKSSSSPFSKASNHFCSSWLWNDTKVLRTIWDK